MKTRVVCLAALVSALLLPRTFAAATSAPDKVAPEANPPVVAPDSPETTLKLAMTADEVRKIMGQAVEIKPMKAPNGKAEIWVYKREFNQRVERVQIATIPITTTVVGTDGVSHQQQLGEDIKFGDLHRVTQDTVEVLMFNDHYVTHKVTRRELRHYN